MVGRESLLAGACAEERADSLLFLSALVVWQQDFDICSGLSCFVNSLVQLSPRLFSSGLFLRRGSAADGPAASPSILPLRASGVFRQLFCSPRGPHFLLLPFCVGAAARSFWSALPRQPSLRPAEGCGLSAISNVITIYFVRSKSTPLFFSQFLLPSSPQVLLPLPLACFFAPSPGKGVCLRALATSLHCFVLCLWGVQASVVGLFEALPAGQLRQPGTTSWSAAAARH